MNTLQVLSYGSRHFEEIVKGDGARHSEIM